jgi:uncharacterized protein
MDTLLSAPVGQSQRIKIIDSIRGIALLGILMMNIPFFANPFQYWNLNVLNEYSGRNYYTWWVVNGLFEGTMRALFTMLFGAGCLLLLNRLEKKGPDTSAPDIYYRRLIWLLLFGLVNAYVFLWPGDILYTYALCGLFLFPFRKLKARHLLYFGIAFLVFSTAKGTYNLYQAKQTRVKGEQALVLEKKKVKLTEEQTEAKEAWVGRQERTKVENLQKDAQKEIKKIGGQGYFGTLAYLSTINAKIESTKFYHDYFFDAMMLLFVGMALFKWGVLTGERSTRFYWTLLAAGYVVGLPLSYYEHHTLVAVRFDSTLLFDRFYVHPYQLRRTALAFGHLSLIVLLYKSGLFQWALNRLANVGQMAFTNYLMQSLICVTLFYGFGFGLFGRLQRYEAYYVVFAVWAFQLVFSSVWLHYFQFGPFEWVWRSLTYWKKQPMRRGGPGGEETREGEVRVVEPGMAVAGSAKDPS